MSEDAMPPVRYPIFKGNMGKKGNDLFGSWAARFLYTHDGTLDYYEHEGGKLKGTIDLRETKSVVLDGLKIKLNVGKRSYEFEAYSSAEASKWEKIFNYCMTAETLAKEEWNKELNDRANAKKIEVKEAFERPRQRSTAQENSLEVPSGMSISDSIGVASQVSSSPISRDRVVSVYTSKTATIEETTSPIATVTDSNHRKIGVVESEISSVPVSVIDISRRESRANSLANSVSLTDFQNPISIINSSPVSTSSERVTTLDKTSSKDALSNAMQTDATDSSLAKSLSKSTVYSSVPTSVVDDLKTEDYPPVFQRQESALKPLVNTSVVASTVSSKLSECPTLTGTLSKKGQGMFGSLWKARTFVLENNIVTYSADGETKGAIDLDGCDIIRDGRFLRIITKEKDRTYELRGDSITIASDWERAMTSSVIFSKSNIKTNANAYKIVDVAVINSDKNINDDNNVRISEEDTRNRNESISASNNRSASPSKDRSASPAKDRSASPAKDRSASPAKDRSASPAKESAESAAKAKDRSASPVENRSISPKPGDGNIETVAKGGGIISESVRLSMFPKVSSPPKFSGPLEKKGKGMFGMGWKPRTFVLDNNIVTYCCEGTIKGTFDLSGCSVTRDGRNMNIISKEQARTFEVRAETIAIAIDWERVLSQSIAFFREESVKKQLGENRFRVIAFESEQMLSGDNDNDDIASLKSSNDSHVSELTESLPPNPETVTSSGLKFRKGRAIAGAGVILSVSNARRKFMKGLVDEMNSSKTDDSCNTMDENSSDVIVSEIEHVVGGEHCEWEEFFEQAVRNTYGACVLGVDIVTASDMFKRQVLDILERCEAEWRRSPAGQLAFRVESGRVSRQSNQFDDLPAVAIESLIIHAVVTGETQTAYQVLSESRTSCEYSKLLKNMIKKDILWPLLDRYFSQIDLVLHRHLVKLRHDVVCAALIRLTDAMDETNVQDYINLLSESKVLLDKIDKSSHDILSTSKFLSLMTSEQILLVQFQYDNKTRIGIPLGETLIELIKIGRRKIAKDGRDRFQVPKKRWIWLKLTSFAESSQWKFYESYGNKIGSSIGYRHLVMIALQYKNSNIALKFVASVEKTSRVRCLVDTSLLLQEENKLEAMKECFYEAALTSKDNKDVDVRAQDAATVFRRAGDNETLLTIATSLLGQRVLNRT